MNTHLILMISPDSLVSTQPETPMRTGSLTALKKLSENRVLLVMKTSDLSSNISGLLRQEEIPILDQIPDNLHQTSEILTLSVTNSGELMMTGSSGKSSSPRTFSGWPELVAHLLENFRTASIHRKTEETDIQVSVVLDGTGTSEIDTGIPFFDHMLEQISRHGYMDLVIRVKGDLHIDEHHTVEDTAIALGEALASALGDKRGIGRYGFAVAMDETRSLAMIDLSGRAWCVFEGRFQREKVGGFPTEMTSHFFHSLAMSLKATLHVAVKGENDHHQIEACFKALARCLRQAVDRNEKYLDILPSSKGLL